MTENRQIVDWVPLEVDLTFERLRDEYETFMRRHYQSVHDQMYGGSDPAQTRTATEAMILRGWGPRPRILTPEHLMRPRETPPPRPAPLTPEQERERGWRDRSLRERGHLELLVNRAVNSQCL